MNNVELSSKHQEQKLKYEFIKKTKNKSLNHELILCSYLDP